MPKASLLLGKIEKADETPFFFDMLRQQFMDMDQNQCLLKQQGMKN
jgi:hypothetical protein